MTSPVALLLVDFINDFEFEGAEALLPRALAAARATAELRRLAKQGGVPVVYCNDNFGKWRSDFKQLLAHCLEDGVRGEPIARLLQPDEDDYFVLKPKHSAFHSTSLDILLAHLGTRTIVLTGLAGDFCVLLTAHDAYMRDYRLHVPSDCVASEPDEDNRAALGHMAKVCKADIRASPTVDFQVLCNRRISMSDDVEQTGNPDDQRINVNQDHELSYWSEKLGVSRDRLREAVAKAGPMVRNVERELGSR